MPVFEDWLRNPLSIINNIFASDPVNFDTKVKEYFETKLKLEKNYYSIPCLNEVALDDLSPNCLVRYRCMIQDSFDPVYYYPINQVKSKNSNDTQFVTFKYKEVLDSADQEICDRSSLDKLLQSEANDPKISYFKNEIQNLQQRMTFYCVPIPGESEWAKNTYREYAAQNGFNQNSSFSKLAKPDLIQQVDETTNTNIRLNFPLGSDESGVACLVKVYENFDSYKINDIVEFVGILSKDPSLAYMHDENGDSVYMSATNQQMTSDKTKMDQMETDEPNETENQDKKASLSSYPPSLVPRLNCIKSFRLVHNNPLLSNKLTYENDEKEEAKQNTTYWNQQYRSFLADLINDNHMNQLSQEQLDVNLIENSKIYLLKLRQELINCLQEILLGDSLAAEYLLMHLLSTVFMRKDVTVLGKFSLNLTNVPEMISNNENFASCFYRAINQFVSMSHFYDLTVENLNKSNLIPSKDYVKDKLISGMLQLPSGFQLVIDETKLNTGELKQKGLMNVNSLKEVIQWQKLNYDFSYHQQEFQTNLRVLILSQTKSILASDCQLKLKPNVDRLESLDAYLNYVMSLLENKRLIENFRKYLCVLAQLDYKIPESLQKIVEDDIVNVRKTFNLNQQSNDGQQQKENKSMSIEDIHLLLVVARLQCLSFGKSELTINEWNKAKSLELERLTNR